MTRLIPASRTANQLTLTGYSSPPAPAAQEHTASAGDLWRILWCRRRVIVATVAILFAGTLAYGLITPSLYTAASAIIIDPRDRQVVVNDVNPSGVSPDGGITQIESQARVIESSSVLLRAIAATDLANDPEFNGTGGSLHWLMALIDPSLASPATPAQLEARTLAALKRRLAVKRADRVLVIEINVTAEAADKAARLANAIAEAYLADQARAKEQAGAAASAELTARLSEQRARVQEAENRIQKYLAAHNIVSAGGQLVNESQLNDVNTQLAAAQTRTAALRAQVDQIDAVRRSGLPLDSTAEAMGSAVIARLREQEATLVQRQAELQAQYGPNHPAITSIRSQLGNVRALISTELNRIANSARADYQRALADQNLLQGQVDRLKAATLATGQASVELRELQRDLDASRSVYTAFLQRAQETREQAGIDTTNARIITRATPPPKRSWPPLPLLLAGALGSGLGLGAGLALVREYVTPTVLSRAQIEAALDTLVVGVLPAAALAGSKRRFGRSGAMDPGQQSLGIAGLALRRMFELDPMIPHDSSMVRSLLVTSAPQDAEARRRACRLFASAAAMRGQRVLLIDADLAHPSRQEAAGLLDVLRGDCKLDAAVDIAQPPEVSLLDRGRERSGAFDNDGRGFARRMFTEARPLFDLAVIDGGALIENLRVAPLVTTADEVLLVAQLGISSQNAALAAAESASVMGRPVTAVMLFDAPV